MTSYQTRLTELYSRWLHSSREMFTYRMPQPPVSVLAAKAEQVAANEEWEGEGGSTKGKK